MSLPAPSGVPSDITGPVGMVGHVSQPPLWERGFAGLGLYLSTGAGIPVLEWILGVVPSQDVRQGDSFGQAIWSVVYLVAAVLLFTRLPRVVRALPALGSLWILLLLALVSQTWSFAPDVTLRRSVALLGTSLFSVYLGTRYSNEDLFRILFWVLAASVVASLAWSLIPGLNPSPGARWIGVFNGHNLLGRAMAVTAMVSLLYAMAYPRKSYLGAAVCALAIMLLLLSGSKGALVVLIASVGLFPVIRMWRLRRGLAVNALLAAVAAAGVLSTWLAGNSEAVLNLLGRDASLTGRTPLWELLWGKINLRPLLGYGYGGFWLQWDGPSADIWRVCIKNYGWLPPDGHNGFIDLWLDLGLLGLAAFLVSLASSLGRALELARRQASAIDLFPILFLNLLVLSNLTTSALVTHNSLFWLLYGALAMQLRLGR